MKEEENEEKKEERKDERKERRKEQTKKGTNEGRKSGTMGVSKEGRIHAVFLSRFPPFFQSYFPDPSFIFLPSLFPSLLS